MKSKQKQKKFLEAFEKSYGVISYACKAANISRQTYYNWRKNDPEFDVKANEIEETAIDIAEGKLFAQIGSGNITAIIFYLKTKGKKRGYVEQVDNNVTMNPFEKLMQDLDKEESEE
jgi:hypothetical protein